MLRGDRPNLFRGVRSMRCFVWQNNMVLVSRFVRDAMRMVRAAGSGHEVDVSSAKLAGTDVIIFFFFFFHVTVQKKGTWKLATLSYSGF